MEYTSIRELEFPVVGLWEFAFMGLFTGQDHVTHLGSQDVHL